LQVDQDDLKVIFSNRLQLVVEARGYPKNNYGRNTMLANELGITPPYVYKLFHGQIGSPYTLRKLAVHLNTTIDFLLGISDIMDRSEPQNEKSPDTNGTGDL
jgi:hypothetical protein